MYADSLQEGKISSIRPTDYKYTKASILHSKVIGVTDLQFKLLMVIMERDFVGTPQ